MPVLLRNPLFYVLLAGTLLSGCDAVHGYFNHHENHDQTCRRQGWEPDTQQYDECIEKLKQEHSEKEMPESLLDGGWWIGTWF